MENSLKVGQTYKEIIDIKRKNDLLKLKKIIIKLCITLR